MRGWLEPSVRRPSAMYPTELELQVLYVTVDRVTTWFCEKVVVEDPSQSYGNRA